jgi:hypothetical protein
MSSLHAYSLSLLVSQKVMSNGSPEGHDLLLLKTCLPTFHILTESFYQHRLPRPVREELCPPQPITVLFASPIYHSRPYTQPTLYPTLLQ